MAAVTICTDFGAPPKIKSLTVSTVSPSIYHEVIAGRNINNLRYADDTTFMAESKEELKSLLVKVKEKSEKAGLKLNIHKLRSWHPVPSLHGIDGETMETVRDFIFGGAPKSLQIVTAAMKLKDACFLEEKL